MKIQRVILLICLVVLSKASLFAKDDAKTRKSKRVAADKEYRKENIAASMNAKHENLDYLAEKERKKADKLERRRERGQK
jgi:hypothetical protein